MKYLYPIVLTSLVIIVLYLSVFPQYDSFLSRWFEARFGAISFPTSLDVLTNPSGTDSTATVSHSGQHSDANDAVEALEAKVGIDGSAVTTSHDFKLSGVTGSDKAVSLDGTETLTNKTLTLPFSLNDTSADHQYLWAVSELTADRTVTWPLLTGNDIFLFNANVATITNKIIDGDDNTILDFNASNMFKSATAVAIANGGTSQTTQTAAFDALSPLTTKGDVIVFNGSDNVRLAVGANDLVLTADSGEASGVKWASAAVDTSSIIGYATSSFSRQTNCATEFEIFSVAVPANTLSTDGGLRFTANVVEWDAASAGAGNWIFRIGFGGATTSVSLSDSTAIVDSIGTISATILADGATNAQHNTIYTDLMENDFGDSKRAYGTTTSSIDSTVQRNFIFTGDCGSNNSGNNIRIDSMILTSFK